MKKVKNARVLASFTITPQMEASEKIQIADSLLDFLSTVPDGTFHLKKDTTLAVDKSGRLICLSA